MNEKPVLTMKDIARELGVSVATVSRALKDSPNISQEQRERVKAFAREHHFTPNVIAESLRHSRVQPMKVIGVIVPDITSDFFAGIVREIEENERGYYVTAEFDEEVHL
jgi:DNA-binding LacI/PurR family transcriptional regulator